MNDLQKFESFTKYGDLCINNNLCGKLFSSLESPTTFDESFKVTSVQYFLPDFNSLTFECKVARTHNNLCRKRTFNHLAKLAK